MDKHPRNIKDVVQKSPETEVPDRIAHTFEKEKYPPSYKLVSNRQVCRKLYYLESGLVRCSNFADRRTLWFEVKHSFFTVPDSFIHQSPSAQELSCVEESIIYALPHAKLQAHCQKNLEWANWWSDVLEQEYLKLQYIYRSLLYKSASERYRELIYAIPDIELRVPLKHIASFLGISQVSLSRIRAGKQ